MNWVTFLNSVIELLVGAIKGIGQGIGSGLSALAESIFLVTTGTGEAAVTSLSTFGAIVIIFAGISLAFGLTRWVLNFITSLGARNR